MAAKRILLLDGTTLTAHCWNSGHVRLEGEFNHDPAGLESFAGYLRKHRSSLFFLLADTTEEGFQLEEIPFVQGRDRSALLQRRLGQYFYSTPLSTVIPLGRSQEGRRDEKVLFAALTRVETFAPWLETLREAESILAGVYSVPLVLAGCAAALLDQGSPILLVTLTRGGVRQTFFDKGKLHFSRLSQLATHSLDEIGRSCASDTAKIFQYLVAQRQIPRGTALRTVVLAHAGQIPTLQDFCRNSNDLQFDFVDIVAATRQRGLKDVPHDSNADNLLIHCLVTKTPGQQFAAASETRYYQLWKIRAALTGAAWVALTACLLFAGKTGLNIHESREAVEASKLATASDAQRYKGILDGLPQVNITPENLRTLIDRVDALQKRAPAMEPLLTHLSLALNDTPRIELVRLTWKLVDHFDSAATSASTHTPAQAPSVGTGKGGNWVVIEMHGQLPLGLVTDQRAQIELIEGFASQLRDPQTQVKVLTRPFDIESDKPLRSAGDRSDLPVTSAPQFSLRIARQT